MISNKTQFVINNFEKFCLECPDEDTEYKKVLLMSAYNEAISTEFELINKEFIYPLNKIDINEIDKIVNSEIYLNLISHPNNSTFNFYIIYFNTLLDITQEEDMLELKNI